MSDQRAYIGVRYDRFRATALCVTNSRTLITDFYTAIIVYPSWEKAKRVTRRWARLLRMRWETYEEHLDAQIYRWSE